MALAGLVALAAAAGPPATASTFSVNPTRIDLSGRALSTLLSLRNDSDQPLRFEISAFSWAQTTSGEMMLEPTEDIVFFPTLLTLAPSEERKVRIGAVVKPGAKEKAYRLFVRELPPLDGSRTEGVRVLTKMGIPIFVRPDKAIVTPELGVPRHENGQLQFGLVNSGNVHFIPERITIRGLAGDIGVFERPVESWYVHAAGRRDFTVSLPETECARVTTLLVQAEVGSSRLEKRIETPGGACAH
jgi:fimbrial chaperone protein